MTFAINAATTVRMSGARYMHAAVLQTFTSRAVLPTLRLSARARQFSSFILMVCPPCRMHAFALIASI